MSRHSDLLRALRARGEIWDVAPGVTGLRGDTAQLFAALVDHVLGHRHFFFRAGVGVFDYYHRAGGKRSCSRRVIGANAASWRFSAAVQGARLKSPATIRFAFGSCGTMPSSIWR